MSQTASAERRRFQRIQLERAATVTVGDRVLDCELVDISIKGVLIRGDVDWQLEIGQRMDVLILVAADAASCIQVTAEVAHMGGNCIGAHIYSMDIDSSVNLRRLIEFNLGVPELLQRELSAMISDI